MYYFFLHTNRNIFKRPHVLKSCVLSSLFCLHLPFIPHILMSPLFVFQTCSRSSTIKEFAKCPNVKFLKFLKAVVLFCFRNMVFQLTWDMQWLHTILGSIQCMFNFMMPGKRSGISELPAQKNTLIWSLQGIEEASSTKISWWVVFMMSMLQRVYHFTNYLFLSWKSMLSWKFTLWEAHTALHK